MQQFWNLLLPYISPHIFALISKFLAYVDNYVYCLQFASNMHGECDIVFLQVPHVELWEKYSSQNC
uniref:Uncharacterized protein n=1 Tax=Rhizophora mucronata TaxID=61149 RepID=A0A2P2LFA5_RHIMU